MPRRRIITEDFLSDADLQEGGEVIAFLLLGLVLNADDYGIVSAHPATITTSVFRFAQRSRAEVEKMLEDLVARRMILPFTFNGKPYYALRAWFKHQRLAHPQPLTVMPPPEVIDAMAEAVRDPQNVLVIFSEKRQREIVEYRRGRAVAQANRRHHKREEPNDYPEFE